MEGMRKEFNGRKLNTRSHLFRRGIALFFAAIVVFVTTYSLILPAISLELEVAEQMPGIVLESEAAPETMAETIPVQVTEAAPETVPTPEAVAVPEMVPAPDTAPVVETAAPAPVQEEAVAEPAQELPVSEEMQLLAAEAAGEEANDGSKTDEAVVDLIEGTTEAMTAQAPEADEEESDSNTVTEGAGREGESFPVEETAEENTADAFPAETTAEAWKETEEETAAEAEEETEEESIAEAEEQTEVDTEEETKEGTEEGTEEDTTEEETVAEVVEVIVPVEGADYTLTLRYSTAVLPADVIFTAISVRKDSNDYALYGDRAVEEIGRFCMLGG